MTKRFYRTKGAAGYGDRIYLESGSLYHGLLSKRCMWGGNDKRSYFRDGSLFLGYEFCAEAATELESFLLSNNLSQVPLSEVRDFQEGLDNV